MAIGTEEAARRVSLKGLRPLEPYPGSGSAEWKLQCEICDGLTSESLVKVEKRRRSGCQVCCSKSQHRLTDSEAIARLESHKLTALEDYPGQVSDPWKVRCTLCNTTHKTSISTLSKRENPGCPSCGLRQARQAQTVSQVQAEQRLASLGFAPIDPYPGGTKRPWKVRCKTCGNLSDRSLNQLETRPRCPKCARLEALDKASNSAETELKKAGLKPLAPFPGPSKGWPAECLVCGRRSNPRLNSIRYQKSGCRHCAYDAVRQKRLDESLAKSIAQLKKSGFSPVGEYRGFTKPWRSKCNTCGKVSSPAPKWLSAGHGCRHCAPNAPWSRKKARDIGRQAKRKFLEDFQGATVSILMECLRCGNRLKAKPTTLLTSKGYCNACKKSAEWTPGKAVQVLKAANMEPLEPYPGSTTSKWKAQCNSCSTVGYPRVANISGGQGACKVCGNFGFDIRKPTTLYVLLNQEVGALKVGITNTGSTRLRTLASVGFKPGKLYKFDEGSQPLEIETALLRYLKKTRKFKQALSKQQMKGAGGATETFWLREANPQLVHSRIRALLAD